MEKTVPRYFSAKRNQLKVERVTGTLPFFAAPQLTFLRSATSLECTHVHVTSCVSVHFGWPEQSSMDLCFGWEIELARHGKEEFTMGYGQSSTVHACYLYPARVSGVAPAGGGLYKY